ncbi:MAG: hypothetical protein GX046_07360 [Tissierellia bacterium]|nr:hypothetical protein [Tissierellia bacterium]
MNKKIMIGLLILVLVTTVACGKKEETPAQGAVENGETEQIEEEKAPILPSNENFVAEIDGKGITKEEFEKSYLFRKYSYIKSYGEEVFTGEGAKTLERNMRLQVQEELAREQIYVLLAENAGFKKDMTEAAKIYEEDFIARNTDETLKYFEENNLDKDYVTNRIAIEQLVGSFIQKLQDDYLDSDGFVEKEKTLNLVRASHILVNTQEEALEIKGLINEEPSRFEMLAKERSTCASAENEGDLGYFEATDMAEEFSKAAFAMEIDEISEVVASQFGYHIIKLTDKGTLFEILERGSEDPYLDQKLLDLSYQVVGEKLKNLYDEQLLKTPIQYYSIEE